MVTHSMLENILGFLSHCCQVVPLGRPFLRNLFSQICRSNSRRHLLRFRLTHDSRIDLRWWLQFLRSWSSISMIQLSRICFDVATDASGAKGIGGVYKRIVFSERIPSRVRDTSLRRSIGKRRSQFFMPFCSGTKNGGEEKSVLPVTIRALLMHLTNILSKAQQLSLFNGYFSSPRFTIFKSSHSGSHLKRIWWRMRHLVMITTSLLTLVCRYATISLDHHSCAGSCVPSSQLPRSEYSAKVHKNP